MINSSQPSIADSRIATGIDGEPNVNVGGPYSPTTIDSANKDMEQIYGSNSSSKNAK